MDLDVYIFLDVPFMVLVYLAVLLFARPPRIVILAALLAGLVMALVNLLADLLAYYAHWWHYTLAGLVLHLPLPFYLPAILIYGGIGYFLIWRLWQGRWHWLAMTLLIAIPLFRALADYLRAVTQTGYAVWDSPPALAGGVDLVQHLLAFYAGYLLFRLLVPVQPVRQS
jgi:hypothetical protein